jgi:hypothetical protein
MKRQQKKSLGLLLCALAFLSIVNAQHTLPAYMCLTSESLIARNETTQQKNITAIKAPDKRLNFYVISNDKKKFSPMLLRMKIKAGFRSVFSKKTMYLVVADNAGEAAKTIEQRIKKSGDKKIGNIWFDSHGHYAHGYSSFSIGTDEFNARNVTDTTHTMPLKRIASYCDEFTQIGIGSCYGGATFIFPGSPKVASQPMNGDSLMIGIGKIFTSSYIYGCESFVMMKPGVFKNGYALAGYPLNKRFMDTGFKPVWERLGEWHRYQNASNTFENVNTVSLNKYGEICLLQTDYQDLDKKRETIERKISHLKPGLYKKFQKNPLH